MIKRVLAFKGRTHAGGQYIEAGVPVAIIESDIAWDSLLAAVAVGNLIEIDSDAPLLAADVVEPPVDETPKSSTGGEAAIDEAPEPTEEIRSESPQTETCLKDCGLTHSLADRLAANGITTAEQLGEFVAGNGELAELEGVGPARAKRIMTWWNSRQS